MVLPVLIELTVSAHARTFSGRGLRGDICPSRCQHKTPMRSWKKFAHLARRMQKPHTPSHFSATHIIRNHFSLFNNIYYTTTHAQVNLLTSTLSKALETLVLTTHHECSSTNTIDHDSGGIH